MEALPKRKPTRLQGFDYNSIGMYFITICTQNRRCLLSRIVGTGVPARSGDGLVNYGKLVGTGVPDCPKVELTKYGAIADKYIRQMNDFYDHLSVEAYVIMPNHIHFLVFVKENGQSGTPVPTTNVTRANSSFSKFISTFKRFCNKEYGENIWQARSNDHIIRDREDYEEHLRYIRDNPKRWRYDELYAEE